MGTGARGFFRGIALACSVRWRALACAGMRCHALACGGVVSGETERGERSRCSGVDVECMMPYHKHATRCTLLVVWRASQETARTVPTPCDGHAVVSAPIYAGGAETVVDAGGSQLTHTESGVRSPDTRCVLRLKSQTVSTTSLGTFTGTSEVVVTAHERRTSFRRVSVPHRRQLPHDQVVPLTPQLALTPAADPNAVDRPLPCAVSVRGGGMPAVS